MSKTLPVIDKVELVNAHTRDGVCFYVIYVVTAEGEKFYSSKRYSQFEDFHAFLLDCVSEHILPAGAALPARRSKFLTNHDSSDFIEERLIILDNYLKLLLTVPSIASSEVFYGFLASDKILFDETQHRIPLNELIKSTNLPEDSEVTNIAITNTKYMSDHVLFLVEVSNSHRSADPSWHVLKRSSQVYDLASSLEASPDLSNVQLPSPPARTYSKLFSNWDNEHHVEHRRLLLQRYLQRLLLIPQVHYNQYFLNFLGVE